MNIDLSEQKSTKSSFVKNDFMDFVTITPINQTDLSAEKKEKAILFHLACKNGDLNEVKKLFQEDHNIINIVCQHSIAIPFFNPITIDYFPIIVALEYRHYDIVDFILDNGFILEMKNLISNYTIYYNFEIFQKVLNSVMLNRNAGVNFIFITDDDLNTKLDFLYPILLAISRAKNSEELKGVIKSLNYLINIGLNIKREGFDNGIKILAQDLKSGGVLFEIKKLSIYNYVVRRLMFYKIILI